MATDVLLVVGLALIVAGFSWVFGVSGGLFAAGAALLIVATLVELGDRA